MTEFTLRTEDTTAETSESMLAERWAGQNLAINTAVVHGTVSRRMILKLDCSQL